MELNVLTSLLPAPSLSMQELDELKDKVFTCSGEVRVFEANDIDHIDKVDADNANSCQVILIEKDGIKRVNMGLRNFVQLVIVAGAGDNKVESSMVEAIQELSKTGGKVVFPKELTIDTAVVLQEKNIKGVLKDVYPMSAYPKYRKALDAAEKKWEGFDDKKQAEQSAYQLVHRDNRGMRAELLDLKADTGIEAIKSIKVRI